MDKKEKNAQNKGRMCITVSREIYEFITKTRGNASKIAERGYSALFSAVKENKADNLIVMDLKLLKISSESQKET